MESDETPKCPNGRIDLRGLGQLPVRVGGVSPGWHFFLGELADIGERIKPLDPIGARNAGVWSSMTTISACPNASEGAP